LGKEEEFNHEPHKPLEQKNFSEVVTIQSLIKRMPRELINRGEAGQYFLTKPTYT